MTRRGVLKSALISGIPALLPVMTPGVGLAQGTRRSGTRIAVSTYSYWHFRTEKYPIEKVIENAARLGFDGVEILHRQMANETPAYCNKLKQLAFQHGLSLPMLSIHQDFVHPEESERRKHIAHTEKCIGLAAQLGIPAIRLNSGRWKTIPSFDELMKVKGAEPPVPGHTNEDAFRWVVDSIRACLPQAEKAGVVMALENHWGLTTDVDLLLRIWREVKSPWLVINADTGNFPGDPYEGLAKLAPHAAIVQAKTYYGGGEWYTLDLDYKRISKILKDAGFKGWVSLEMEGKESPETAVPKSLEVLRSAFA